MPATEAATRPDLTQRPHSMTCERRIRATPEDIYAAWTTNQFERWFAAQGTALMTPQIDVPYFFETRFEGQRHPHYGRFLRLEPNRLVEMTWLTAMGTKGAETVVTIELIPEDDGTLLRLTHAGFPDVEARDGHADAWPMALEILDDALRAEGPHHGGR